MSKELDNTIKMVLDKGIKREKAKEIIEVILSSSEINKISKNSNAYYPNSSSMPFSDYSITNGRRAIQNLLEQRCSSDLNLSF
ncbi:hypothetical protein [Senegalia massiliensis]|uniref:hypothetical protein n=1 Tax=Senegalia massiliensis TaxID=1720316 RepID=UPI0010301427|nr:hypothetical protein [Senegalia massiliensis]